MSSKIDLVYLWVDGSDKKWLEKKNAYLSKLSNVDKEAIDDCRFVQHDELKYSLRSVEKYAPWINHIYIVTDNQVPKWLNTKNKKITIVDHKDIMPKTALPCFNSTAIEHCIVNIPELSENFLYANDDMFFWNNVEPDFFFDNDGKVICRFCKKIKNRKYKHLYGSMVNKSYQITKDKFGKCTKYFPCHSIDAYKKSELTSYQKYFNQSLMRTLNSKFRDIKDLHRSIYNYFMVQENKGVSKIISKSWFKKEENGYVKLKTQNMKNILKSQYPILCINECNKTNSKDVDFMINLLNKKFPQKSEFEA